MTLPGQTRNGNLSAHHRQHCLHQVHRRTRHPERLQKVQHHHRIQLKRSVHVHPWHLPNPRGSEQPHHSCQHCQHHNKLQLRYIFEQPQKNLQILSAIPAINRNQSFHCDRQSILHSRRNAEFVFDESRGIDLSP